MWIIEKILSLLLVIVISSIAVPVTYENNYAPDHEYKPKDYSFSYGVKDLHTGDVKHQWEKKEGDQIRGHYSVLEPDGSVRIVDYTADPKTGFNAVVKHEGTSYHPSPSKPTSHRPTSHNPTSHREFELKSGTVKEESALQDYTLLKELEDSKSSVTQVDSYGNYIPVKNGYPVAQVEQIEQVEQTHQEEQEQEQEEKYIPEYKYEYVPQDEAADQYAYEATSHTYEEADFAADSSKQEKIYATHQSKAEKLPIDLHVIKPHLKEDIIPLDVSILKPVEINLNDVKGSNHVRIEADRNANINGKSNFSSHIPGKINIKDSYLSATTPSPYNKVTEDDYQNFLKEYYKSENIGKSQQLSEEEYEKFLKNYYKEGEKPIAKPYDEINFKQNPSNRNKFPNTFITNKKPATTPGLRNYSSGIKHSQTTRRPKLQYQAYGNRKGPVLFPMNRNSNGLKPRFSSVYRNSGNHYLRYAKHITS